MWIAYEKVGGIYVSFYMTYVWFTSAVAFQNVEIHITVTYHGAND